MNRSKSRKVFPTACKVVQTLFSVKHKRQMISALLAVLLLASNAQAQTGDWQAVKNLRPGTRISVKTQHRYPCFFASATEDELVCNGPDRLLRLPPRMTFSRGEIREIRMGPNQAKDAWIGAGIGTGAGAIAAGTGSRDYPGFHAFIGGLAGAGVGALVGATVPIFQEIFHHGKIIYK